jgi:hypothetical protein
VQLPADLPFGLNAEGAYRRTDLRLEPGDRFVIVTDGLLERRAAALPLAALLEESVMTDVALDRQVRHRLDLAGFGSLDIASHAVPATARRPD